MLRLLVLLCLLLVGCVKRSMAPSSESESGRYGGYDDMDGAPAPAAPAMEEMAKKSSKADEARTDPATTTPAKPADRMVHYDGWLRLRVTRVDAGVDAVRQLAEEQHGFVEAIGADHVIVRVPVARFRDAYAAARGLGEVLDESISAADVTEAFTSADLRLRTARATRERLQALLARSEDEQEKLQLLREIQRVTEQIDQLEAQLKTLASLAAFSRITVQLVPREALAWQGPGEETAELAWIRGLSPFRNYLPIETGSLDLPEPTGFVRLSPRGPLVAESADGARLWSHRLDNTPRGDAAFWLDALTGRLGPDFGTAEPTEIGGWRVLRLVDRSDEPYSWWIAVRVDGDRLHLVQAFYPSPAAEQRHGDAVRAALTEVAS